MYYLLKTEPTTYSFDDLRREKSTVWDGVTNPVALRNLREMKPGDELIIYHTGDEKRTVGTATVQSVDPSNPKSPVVKITAGQPLATAVSLAEMKAAREFATSQPSAIRIRVAIERSAGGALIQWASGGTNAAAERAGAAGETADGGARPRRGNARERKIERERCQLKRNHRPRSPTRR